MKRSVLIALCLVLGASVAFGQPAPGAVNVYSDAGLSSCNIDDSVAGLITLYVAHMYADQVGSVLFKLDLGTCADTWSLLGTIIPWDLTIGDLFTGISIAYGVCSTSPLQLATINYFGSGLNGPCCYISVVASPDATSGSVEAVDCTLNRMLADGGQAIVNPVTDVCECDTPVQDNTWGGIKALYQ
jgi:hypothetical protein